MKSKVSSLERELDLFRANKPKISQHLDKNASVEEKNKTQPTKQRKSILNPVEPIVEEMYPIPSRRNVGNTPSQ